MISSLKYCTFPPTFNSYPITEGALSCTGQINPIVRGEKPLLMLL